MTNPYQAPETRIDSRLNKKGKAIDVVCPKCQHQFNDVPGKSFLGFKSLGCPECGEKFNYPLHTGYRITYWVLLGIATLAMIGAGGRPNLYFVLMAYAVLTDLYMQWKRR